jgi:hypothetical protein
MRAARKAPPFWRLYARFERVIPRATNVPCVGELAMTMKRVGDAWMPADEYGRVMPKSSLNLLVREVARSVPFYKIVLGATVRYVDQEFGAESAGCGFHAAFRPRLRPSPAVRTAERWRCAWNRRGIARDGDRSGCSSKKSKGCWSKNHSARNGFSARMARRDARGSGWLHLGRGRGATLRPAGWSVLLDLQQKRYNMRASTSNHLPAIVCEERA